MKYKYKQQISLGFDGSGKRIRKWVYANTVDELALAKAELRKNYREGWVSGSTPFIEYANKWLEVFKASNAPATQEGYRHSIAQCEMIHSLEVRKITSMDCQKIINDFMDRPDTAKKVALTLNQIFKQLVKDGAINRNPAEDLKLPVKVKHNKRVLTAAEKDVIRKLLNSDTLREQDKIFLGILFYCGMRPEEVRGLMRSDINWSDGSVTISRALSYTGELGDIKPTKTYNVRTIPFPDVLLPMLKKYCSNLNSLYLFTRSNGTLHTRTSYRRMWGRIKDQINIGLGGNKTFNMVTGLQPYTFRRNYATNLYYSNISLKKAAYLLGHADTKMITEVYAQIDDERENLDALRHII